MIKTIKPKKFIPVSFLLQKYDWQVAELYLPIISDEMQRIKSDTVKGHSAILINQFK